MKFEVDPTDADALRAALLPSRSCATIEQLSRLCDRDHAGTAEARTAEHVAGCVRCRTELALLKQFETDVLRPDEEEDASWIVARLARDVPRMIAGEVLPKRNAPPGRPAGWRRFVNLRTVAGSLAAASAAVVVAVNIVGRDASPPALAPGATAGPEIFRSEEVILEEPAGDVAVAPKLLRWHPAAGAYSYSVEVLEVDRTPVWSGESREPKLALPPPVRARMVPGKPFLWQVVAKDLAGKSIATSQVQKFRVRIVRAGSGGVKEGAPMSHGNVRRRPRWITQCFRVLALCLLGDFLLAAKGSSDCFSGVSLRVLNSSAPPGGTIQLTSRSPNRSRSS